MDFITKLLKSKRYNIIIVEVNRLIKYTYIILLKEIIDI